MRGIFLISCAALVIFSCEEDPHLQQADHLPGNWEVTWEANRKELHGDIVFEAGEARLSAYGHADSNLLPRVEYVTYTYEIRDNKLILVHQSSEVQLIYTITERTPEEWKLTYLDDIKVQFRRR